MATPYTLKNLTEVADSAAAFGLGEFQATRFANDDLDVADTGVRTYPIWPHARMRPRTVAGSPPGGLRAASCPLHHRAAPSSVLNHRGRTSKRDRPLGIVDK